MPQKTHCKMFWSLPPLLQQPYKISPSASKVPFLGGAATLTLSIVEIIKGVAPPALLSSVVNFTEYACKAELHETLATFWLQTSLSTVSTIFQIQMDAHEKHKTLMDFLDNHPDIAYYDSASQASVTKSLSCIPMMCFTGVWNTFWNHRQAHGFSYMRQNSY
ncbi:hypothetical protein B0H14DRAFT_2591946 [Mycena olivaceomarginata]|nr:hypothetical protein B0H14DRAFT_2591946 [Mycena olivaceomarginata]